MPQINANADHPLQRPARQNNRSIRLHWLPQEPI
jgi:hypothetical protein